MTRLMGDRTAWSTKMKSLGKRFDHAVVKIIQDGMDDGSIHTKGDARIIAAGITGLCNWSHRWFRPEKHDREQIAVAFSDMVLNGLCSPLPMGIADTTGIAG